MYDYYNIAGLKDSTSSLLFFDVSVQGSVKVYVDCNPDDVGPDIFIDPADTEGLKIFREFAAKMVVHYQTLKNKQS